MSGGRGKDVVRNSPVLRSGKEKKREQRLHRSPSSNARRKTHCHSPSVQQLSPSIRLQTQTQELPVLPASIKNEDHDNQNPLIFLFSQESAYDQIVQFPRIISKHMSTIIHHQHGVGVPETCKPNLIDARFTTHNHPSP